MKRNTTSFRELLRQVHATRREWQPTRAWRNSVMAEVALVHASIMAEELDRLAPRIALAAAALSVAGLLTATWALHDLPGQLLAVLSGHALQPGLLGLGI